MCDAWMPAIKLSLTWEQFLQLPRNSAYKYEYLEDTAYLTPRSRHYHAMLDLETASLELANDVEEGLYLEPVRANAIGELASLFAAAFDRTQPFGSLDDATREQAARQCLERTAGGGDGPLIEPACFVAVPEPRGEPVGAVLVTLLPDGDPCEWHSYHWSEPPPADFIERRLGRPHLTWIFVAPLFAGHGLGSALLGAAVAPLRGLGYTQLASTFLLGNESSMLWHWRCGFRLLPYPGSWRRMGQQWKKRSNRPRPGDHDQK
jgi:GNAT superfamily N-acetyltransferase